MFIWTGTSYYDYILGFSVIMLVRMDRVEHFTEIYYTEFILVH